MSNTNANFEMTGIQLGQEVRKLLLSVLVLLLWSE